MLEEKKIRNHRGTIVATIRLHEELPSVDWLSIQGRAFFRDENGDFVDLPPDPPSTP